MKEVVLGGGDRVPHGITGVPHDHLLVSLLRWHTNPRTIHSEQDRVGLIRYIELAPAVGGGDQRTEGFFLISCFCAGNTWPKHNHQLRLWHIQAERGSWAFVRRKFFQLACLPKPQNSAMSQMSKTISSSLLTGLGNRYYFNPFRVKKYCEREIGLVALSCVF